MADNSPVRDKRHLVAKVLDELDRCEVVHQAVDELLAETEFTDSVRPPRSAPVERETMLRQLPVE